MPFFPFTIPNKSPLIKTGELGLLVSDKDKAKMLFSLAGASIVGVNCHFDPTISLQTVKLMKEGLEAARLQAYLMSQPLAYHTPDCNKQGFIDLPEFPFGKTDIL